MTRIQQTLIINAPVEEIAAYISDPRHMPEWNQLIARVWDVQETPEVVGTTWKIAVKVMGAEQQVTARVSSYEPPHRFGVELVGGAPGMPGLKAAMDVEARPTDHDAADSSSQARQNGSKANDAAPLPVSTLVLCILTLHFPTLMGGAALGALLSPIISEQLRHGLVDLKRILEARQRPANLS